jgi:hypothetical protein
MAPPSLQVLGKIHKIEPLIVLIVNYWNLPVYEVAEFLVRILMQLPSMFNERNNI